MKSLLNKLKLILVIPIVFLSLTPAMALAADAQSAIQCGVNSAAGSNSCTAKPTTSLNDTIKTIVSVLSIAVGVAAVIMIIIGGLRYTSSAGSADAAKNAKDTLLYAVIGLVIAAVAQIVVHFVLSKV
jgi:hypothetical protein